MKGDSGGALYRWYGNVTRRAFAIGIVSRGEVCASKNFPTIYTRLVFIFLGFYMPISADLGKEICVMITQGSKSRSR